MLANDSNQKCDIFLLARWKRFARDPSLLGYIEENIEKPRCLILSSIQRCVFH